MQACADGEVVGMGTRIMEEMDGGLAVATSLVWSLLQRC